MIKAPHISDEEVITNDIVALSSPSKFTWLSRYDHVINSGGLKLLPEVIEEKYKRLIPDEYFVHGKPDPELGEKLVLVVEGDPADDLLESLKLFQQNHVDSVSKHEVPKQVLFLKEFIRTKTGKINRSATFDKAISKA